MTSYVAAGYIAVFGTLALYSVSLILRARQAASKVLTVEKFLDQRHKAQPEQSHSTQSSLDVPT